MPQSPPQREYRPSRPEPNVHVFNVNLTNGYKEDYESPESRQSRAEFAAEVEKLQEDMNYRNEAMKAAMRSGNFVATSDLNRPSSAYFSK